MNEVEKRIVVCSWSLQPASADDLVAKIKACRVQGVQLALEPLLEGSSAWVGIDAKLEMAGVRIVSGMMGCVGEDYATIQKIKETGGVMPDETWPATLTNMRRAAPVARRLGMKLVTFHAGFIPHEAESAEFKKGVERVGEVAKTFASEGIAVALETGQEPAPALVEFLRALDRKDVGVNFDPANMLLYGSGEPIAALRLLLPHVRQVHIKDAVPSNAIGEWGSEVPAGSGKVNWAGFFATLSLAGYGGSYVIEREAGGSRIDDVVTARDLVKKLAGTTLAGTGH